MNVATIGSGVIVERMIEAMRLDGRYNLYCVYSRTKKRAKEFAEKHGIQKYYTDMEEMLNDENVDIVYVASPNSLHYSQSKMALEHKKHVINEKPFTPTLKECNELFEKKSVMNYLKKKKKRVSIFLKLSQMCICQIIKLLKKICRIAEISRWFSVISHNIHRSIKSIKIMFKQMPLIQPSMVEL